MAKSIIEFVKMHDGEMLQTARYRPANERLGVIQIIHGFGEHKGQYDALVSFFVSAGYACVFHAQRGFGNVPKRVRGMGGKIVCPNAMHEFYNRNPNAVTLQEYPDGYHCLHSDIVCDEAMENMLRFIEC